MLLREEEITERKRLLRVRHSFGHGRYHDDTVHSFFFHPPIVVVDVPFCLWPVFFSFSFRPSWHSCNTFATLCSSARFGPSGPLCLLFPPLTSALILSSVGRTWTWRNHRLIPSCWTLSNCLVGCMCVCVD